MVVLLRGRCFSTRSVSRLAGRELRRSYRVKIAPREETKYVSPTGNVMGDAACGRDAPWNLAFATACAIVRTIAVFVIVEHSATPQQLAVSTRAQNVRIV